MFLFLKREAFINRKTERSFIAYAGSKFKFNAQPGGHKIVNEEKRFKHKLNMLEPGARMLKWIGILIVIGLLLYFFRFRMAAICVWAVSGIVFAVLLVLLAIESHQDKVLNEIAIEENKKNGEI